MKTGNKGKMKGHKFQTRKRDLKKGYNRNIYEAEG